MEPFPKNLIPINNKPTWPGTPEQFLTTVGYIYMKYEPKDPTIDFDELGQEMLSMINVNLTPYKDFTDLKYNGTMDERALNVLSKLIYRQKELNELVMKEGDAELELYTIDEDTDKLRSALWRFGKEFEEIYFDSIPDDDDEIDDYYSRYTIFSWICTDW